MKILLALALAVLAVAMASGCVGLAPWSVIIDDAAGAPQVQVVDGGWTLQTDATDGNGFWGTGFLYLFADHISVGHVRFVPVVPADAQFRIDLWWSAAANRTTTQPVVVRDATGTETPFTVDLQQNGNRWWTLTTARLAPGAGCYVEFSNDTDDGFCNADAVRFVRAE